MPAQPTPNSDNLLVGKGQLLFNRFDSLGVPTSFKHLGNVDSLELTTADTKIQKYSAMQASAPLYKEANQKRIVTLKVVGDEFAPDNLALVLMGDLATLVQPATAIVGEALAPATVPGSYVKLAKLGPYTAVAVKFGATPGVLGTDYAIINAKMGLIRILPGTILTGAVTADYTPSAYTGTTGPAVVGGGTAGIIQGSFLFIGDPTTGPAMMVEIWKANVSPDSAIGLISEAFATLGLTASILDDSGNHAAHPLYQVTYL
jgi:hypothetical protein